MGDIVREMTLNGETTRVVELTGSGSRQFKMELTDWTELLLTWRWIWTSPASNPTPNPSVFVGICTQGQTFHDTPGGHALGVRAFFADFRLDPFTPSTNAFYHVSAPWLTENGSTTQVSTAYGQYIGRYEILAGTQARGLYISKLNPTTWFCQPCVINAAGWNSADMSHSEFLAASTIPRIMSSVKDEWNAAFSPPNLCYSVYAGGSFTKPDEATYGALDSFLLDWVIDDGDHTCYIHDLHVTRLS